MSSNVLTTRDGATQEAHPYSSQPLTFAHQIMNCPVIMVGGAIHLALILISPCLCFLRLLSTGLALFLLLSAGKSVFFPCFCSVLITFFISSCFSVLPSVFLCVEIINQLTFECWESCVLYIQMAHCQRISLLFLVCLIKSVFFYTFSLILIYIDIFSIFS